MNVDCIKQDCFSGSGCSTASTVCSRAASCWLVRKFFMRLKTFSADAELSVPEELSLPQRTA